MTDRKDHEHDPNPPASDASGSGTGGRNRPGASLSHVGEQASEHNAPSDASGSGTGGKNKPGHSVSESTAQHAKPEPCDCPALPVQHTHEPSGPVPVHKAAK